MPSFEKTHHFKINVERKRWDKKKDTILFMGGDSRVEHINKFNKYFNTCIITNNITAPAQLIILMC